MRSRWSMLQRSLVVLLALWLTLLASMVTTLPAAAQQAAAYDGLDIVFIVDQSGSMGGLEYGSTDHPEPNDPNGLRFFGPRHAVDLLGDYRWKHFSSAVAKRQGQQAKSMRVAVVHFGTEVADALRSTTIAPETEQRWETQQGSLRRALAPPATKKNLGNTDFRPAFERANDIFSQWGQDGQGNRLKVIMVLTDGAPYVDQPGFQRETYLKELVTYTQTRFPAQDNYRIVAFGLNDSRDDYWPTTESYWKQITNGQAQRVASAEDISVVIQDLIQELMVSLGLDPGLKSQCDGDFIVPPYLQEISLDIHKYEPARRPQILVNNVPLDSLKMGSVRVQGQNEPIETITVQQPVPGRWQVTCPPEAGAKITVFRRQYANISTELTQPAGHQYAGLPIQFELHVRDQDGATVKEYDDPAYQLKVSATLQSDGGTPPVVALSKQADGVYAGALTLPKESAGSYNVQVKGVAADAAGETVTLFDHMMQTVEVRTIAAQPVRPFTAVSIHQREALGFQLVDDKGELVPLKAGNQYEIQGEAVITPEGGSPFTLPLAPQDNNTLTADLQPTVAVPHEVGLRAWAMVGANRVDLLDASLGQVPVLAQTVVDFDIVQPANQSSQVAYSLLRELQPFVVEVQLLDDQRRPLDANRVLEASNGSPFRLTILKPDGGPATPNAPMLQPTGEPGRYRAEAHDIAGIGEYEVRVEAFRALQPNHVYSTNQRSALISRIEHPLWLLLPLLGLVLAGVVLSTALQPLLARTGPQLHGELVVRDAANKVLDRLYLDGHRRTARFKHLNPLSGIREVHVRQLKHAPGIALTLKLDDGRKEKEQLVPGGMVFPSGNNSVMYARDEYVTRGWLERLPTLPRLLAFIPVLLAAAWVVYQFVTNQVSFAI